MVLQSKPSATCLSNFITVIYLNVRTMTRFLSVKIRVSSIVFDKQNDVRKNVRVIFQQRYFAVKRRFFRLFSITFFDSFLKGQWNAIVSFNDNGSDNDKLWYRICRYRGWSSTRCEPLLVIYAYNGYTPVFDLSRHATKDTYLKRVFTPTGAITNGLGSVERMNTQRELVTACANRNSDWLTVRKISTGTTFLKTTQSKGLHVVSG